ncbi:MAG: hypothetical protein LBC11_03825 [Puniceicoccales bacterium]|nr:hypothetical protein [Puniceicoccales bacterium]
MTEVANQVTNYGANISKSVTNIWNTLIKPKVGNILNQRGINLTNIADRNASTVEECAKQAGHFAMPIAKLLAGEVLVFGKSAWSLAVAHPVIATAFALVFVIIPVFREYCAANERLSLKTPLVLTWMIITRPFRLVYRILTVITGGTEVDRLRAGQRLAKAQHEIEESREVIEQSQKTIGQLKSLKPELLTKLRGKQKAVSDAVNGVGNNDIKTVLEYTIGRLFVFTSDIFNDQDPRSDDCTVQWNYLQEMLTELRDPQVTAVKNALDEWKECLDLCIATL